MPARLSNEIAQQIVGLHETGATVADIEAELKVSHVSIRRILSDAGFEMDKRPRRNDDYYNDPVVIERVATLYKSGASIKSILEKEKMTSKTVRRILKDAGVYEQRLRKVKADGTREISDEEFIRVWQTSSSARQVELALGLTRQAVNSRMYKFRKNGVPLKKMDRKAANQKDWKRLAEFAKQFLEES